MALTNEEGGRYVNSEFLKSFSGSESMPDITSPGAAPNKKKNKKKKKKNNKRRDETGSVLSVHSEPPRRELSLVIGDDFAPKSIIDLKSINLTTDADDLASGAQIQKLDAERKEEERLWDEWKVKREAEWKRELDERNIQREAQWKRELDERNIKREAQWKQDLDEWSIKMEAENSEWKRWKAEMQDEANATRKLIDNVRRKLDAVREAANDNAEWLVTGCPEALRRIKLGRSLED